MGVTTYKPTVNVPFAMKIKYVDVWPNNPENNYGASLSLRGEIDGVDSKVYPRGFIDKNIPAMAEAGIIAPGTYNYDPAEKYSIPVVDGNATITHSQPAGEKYASAVFTTASAAKPAPVRQGYNTPKALPNEFDGYEHEETAELNAKTGRGPSVTPKIKEAATLWNAARLEVLAYAPDFANDWQALNAAIATVLIQSGKAA